jgi:hypothetical protein
MISFQLAFGTFFLTILGLRRTAQQRPVRHGALDHHPAGQSDQADTFVGGGMSG